MGATIKNVEKTYNILLIDNGDYQDIVLKITGGSNCNI